LAHELAYCGDETGMSKSMAAAATTHLANEVTTLATCWKITRQDGVVLGFTDYHEDLVIGGVNYESQSGLVRATAVSGTSDLGVQNADIETVLDSTTIDREDLQAGRYDYADVRIFMCNYQDPNAWQIKLLRGRLGEVSMQKNIGRAELRSLTELLKQRQGRTHEVSCVYELGDSKCGVTIGSFTVTGNVSTVINQHQFTSAARTEATGWFNQGKIKFTSGNCAGLSMEVQRYTNSAGTKTFILPLDMPYPIQVGDAYEASAGCNKTWATCVSKFNNQNFAGFPFIPGSDYVLSFPSVPSTGS
jgi:uncharacterized phage protein (TIGR02218 family)